MLEVPTNLAKILLNISCLFFIKWQDIHNYYMYMYDQAKARRVYLPYLLE